MNTQEKMHLFAEVKAYHTFDDTLKTCETLLAKYGKSLNQVYLSVPHTFILPLSKKLSESGVLIGGSSMLSAEVNDFTADICTKILIDAQAKFVLIGTALERELIKNTKASLKTKLHHALDAKVAPFLCLTDTEIDFHDGKSKEVLSTQLHEFIDDMTKESLKGLHIIYDAAWISKSPWKTSDETLYHALNNFAEIASEAFTPEILDTIHLAAPVPAASPNLSEILTKLENPPFKFHGFSLGILQ